MKIQNQHIDLSTGLKRSYLMGEFPLDNAGRDMYFIK